LKDVAFKDSELTFKLPYAEVGLIDFKLRLDGDSLKGTLATPQGDTGTVTGTRETAAVSPNVTGKWSILAKGSSGNDSSVTLDVKQEGGKLSGSITTDQGTVPISDGKIDGNQIEFKISLDDGSYTVNGTVDGNQMKGSYKSSSGSGGTFTGTKA